jgi:hypothetical protein
MAITLFIQYKIHPFKHDEYDAYAKRWYDIVPRCGGELLGYWMPHEGTRDIAYCLINFESLAAYEAYREVIKADKDGAANFQAAADGDFILEENRSFLRRVE